MSQGGIKVVLRLPHNHIIEVRGAGCVVSQRPCKKVIAVGIFYFRRACGGIQRKAGAIVEKASAAPVTDEDKGYCRHIHRGRVDNRESGWRIDIVIVRSGAIPRISAYSRSAGI